MAENAALPAQTVLASFETHYANGLRYAWLGEDGDSAVVLGHGLDPQQIAVALDLDFEDLELVEQWMVGLEHSQGCDGINVDVCKACQTAEHEACQPTSSYGCECADNDHDHDLDVACGCEEYAWWAEYLTAEQADVQPNLALAVTTWRG